MGEEGDYNNRCRKDRDAWFRSARPIPRVKGRRIVVVPGPPTRPAVPAAVRFQPWRTVLAEPEQGLAIEGEGD
jgi:hypothetical protein